MDVVFLGEHSTKELAFFLSQVIILTSIKNGEESLLTSFPEIVFLIKKTKHFYICEKHFHPDQYFVHDSNRKTLNPGELPSLNLPVKSIPRVTSTPRQSAEAIFSKKEKNNIFPSIDNQHCYKDFQDFKRRVELLKLPSWNIEYHSNYIVFTFHDNIHCVPKF